MVSKIPAALQQKLIATALSIGAVGGVGYTFYDPHKPSPAVLLAHEIGAYYESSNQHIDTPYIDRNGKGRPLTVCNGVTGPKVIKGKKYSKEECYELEIEILQRSERSARGMFLHWESYNVWVQASIIDMVYNLGDSSLVSSTLLRNANAGDLRGACTEMLRWVYGTVNGEKVKLNGLIRRRDAVNELCSQWGRDGHFSAGLLKENPQ